MQHAAVLAGFGVAYKSHHRKGMSAVNVFY